MPDLKDTYLFSQLDDAQLDRVRSFSQPVNLDDGAALFEAGDEARRFFMVIDGQIKLSRLSLNGNEKVIEVVSAGHTFAEALMFLDRPNYPVRAVALGSTRLLAIDNRAFLALLRESVDTCFRVMGDMGQRLRRLIKEIDDLTLQSASGRVAGYLCGKAHRQQTRVEFDLETPKGVLASRLSVKPETFSRILNNFTTQGLVRVKGGHIEVLDLAGLRAKAESAGICGQSVGPPSVNEKPSP
ncbi:MAG: Crp/Fnr family transcriptional regulator [Gammaproteobacteria bacterium]|nr:Crp/Fnr family transcriptional regulator [Gammaproteobacteria bacterium]